jgi:hypothetical protein
MTYPTCALGQKHYQPSSNLGIATRVPHEATTGQTRACLACRHAAPMGQPTYDELSKYHWPVDPPRQGVPAARAWYRAASLHVWAPVVGGLLILEP